jgi:tRNA G10  N-methylase Trm11
MCGKGNHLLGAVVALGRSHDFDSLEVLGCDLDAQQLEGSKAAFAALQRLQPTVFGKKLSIESRFVQGDVLDIVNDEKEAWDCVVCDPPWGRRHSTFAFVARQMPKWVKAWLEMLNPKGVCLFVTIGTKRVDNRILTDNRLGIKLLESAKFDNCGWVQCKYYLIKSQQKH